MKDDKEKMSDGTPNMALLTGMPVPLTAPGLRGADASSSQSSSAVEPVATDNAPPKTEEGTAKKQGDKASTPAAAAVATVVAEDKPKKEKAGRFAPPTEEELAIAKAKALERTKMAAVKVS